MTPDQERLLLATARIVRANIRDGMKPATRKADVEDLDLLLEPFETKARSIDLDGS